MKNAYVLNEKQSIYHVLNSTFTIIYYKICLKKKASAFEKMFSYSKTNLKIFANITKILKLISKNDKKKRGKRKRKLFLACRISHV